MNRMIAIAAAAVVLGGAGYWWTTQPNAGASMAASAETVSDASGTSAEFGVTEMTLGSADAAIEVIEYASYTCPHCATAHNNLVPRLKEDYVDTGKIRLTYREVYFDKYGMWASLMARCGGEAKFHGITDLIYKGQSVWARAGSDGAIADELRKIGLLAGIGSEELDACMTDETKLQALVGWFQANAKAHNIDSTPTFVIDGKKYPNMGYDEFSAILDEKLGQ